jgi:hypothetical protein
VARLGFALGEGAGQGFFGGSEISAAPGNTSKGRSQRGECFTLWQFATGNQAADTESGAVYRGVFRAIGGAQDRAGFIVQGGEGEA